jgi:hypothetical protein
VFRCKVSVIKVRRLGLPVLRTLPLTCTWRSKVKNYYIDLDRP